MPVKVEQINEYLFSDTVQSKKTKSGRDEISQGQCRGYPSTITEDQIDVEDKQVAFVSNSSDTFSIAC